MDTGSAIYIKVEIFYIFLVLVSLDWLDKQPISSAAKRSILILDVWKLLRGTIHFSLNRELLF